MMEVEKSKLTGGLIFTPKVFHDERGSFFETWNERELKRLGLDVKFVQDNHSRSLKGTLRGLHYQIKDSQGKLVRVSAGEVFDVSVDIRTSSKTFGQWEGVVLSAKNNKQVWIPPGFAHGFLVLSEVAEFQYKCTNFYNSAAERCIRWDDPSLAIDWPTGSLEKVILSKQDQLGRSLTEAEVFP